MGGESRFMIWSLGSGGGGGGQHPDPFLWACTLVFFECLIFFAWSNVHCLLLLCYLLALQSIQSSPPISFDAFWIVAS